MKTFALGAMLALGLTIGSTAPVLASPGDGLDRDAAAQGNGRFGGMHRGARMGAPRIGVRGMGMRHHHARYHRHHRHHR